MTPRPNIKNGYRSHSQRGLALMLVLLVLITGSLAFTVQNQLSVNTAVVSKDAERARRLYQAKQALIAYSVSYADNYLPGGAGPGHLPCPDRSPIDDGVESNDGPDPPCSRATSLIGRFPRFTYSRDQGSVAQNDGPGQNSLKRLVFYSHRSLKDEQMWYVVSRSHINNPANIAVNPETVGLLTVDDHDDIVAVIIDPGPVLSMNSGTRPGDNVRAYLEGANADADFNFTLNADTATFNDLLVSVSRDELMQVVMQRVGLFVVDWLAEFKATHCNKPDNVCYPPAANSDGSCNTALQQGYLPLYLGNCGSSLLQQGLVQGIEMKKHWFVRNEWPRFIRYTRDPVCELDLTGECIVRLSIDSQNESRPGTTQADLMALSMINIDVVPRGDSS